MESDLVQRDEMMVSLELIPFDSVIAYIALHCIKNVIRNEKESL